MKKLTNDEFISAFQEHHGKQMASVQTCGKFQGSGEYWDEFRRRLTIAEAHKRLSDAKDDVVEAAGECYHTMDALMDSMHHSNPKALDGLRDAIAKYREMTNDETEKPE